MDKKLATGQFDALTVIHNETSTGVMSPLAEIAALKKKYPDVMFIVDAVSSMSATKIEFDALGIDVLLAGTQKAFALPPGTAIFTCSKAALAKAATAQGPRLLFRLRRVPEKRRAKHDAEHAEHRPRLRLASKLEDIFAEGLENRFARHKKLAEMTRAWAAKHGFTLFPEKGFESVTLTCVNNGAKPGGRVVDVPKLQKLVKDQGFLIDGGYGKIKGKTFRISNMGDETEATMNQLYAALDKAMSQI